MSDAVRIGILGDFNPEFRSHHATNDALQHAARKLGIEVQSEWIPTPSLIKADAEKKLESFDGFWASPGSPYKSLEGMLKGIQFARVRDWPFLGTCGGFQYAFIEFARNVLNIADADTAENNSGSKNVIIYPVACAVSDGKGNSPKLSGAVPEIRLRPGSYLQSFYGKQVETVTEQFFCNFEINPDFEWAEECLTRCDSPSSPADHKAKSALSNLPCTGFTSQPCSSRNSRRLRRIRTPSFWPLCRPPPTGARRSSTIACWSSLKAFPTVQIHAKRTPL